MSDLTPKESAALRARIVHGADGMPPRTPVTRIVAIAAAFVVVGGIAVGTVGLALGAGRADNTMATPSPTPTESASPTPTPSPTPTEEPLTAPPSRFTVGCDDLTPVVAQLFDAPLPLAATAPGIRAAQTWLPGPASYAFERDGALWCDYGDFADAISGDYVELRIVADASWMADAATAYLGSSCEPTSAVCSSYVIVDDVFINLGARGVATSDPTGGVAVLDAVVAEIRELAAPVTPALTWTPPQPELPVGATCETILPASAVAAMAGFAELSVDNPAGGWSPEASLIAEKYGADPCFYQYPGEGMDGFLTTAMLTWLPSGRASFEEHATGDPRMGTVAEGAMTACDPSGLHGCWVDFAVGGTWFRFTTFDLIDPSPSAERDALFTGVIDQVASAVP